MDICGSNPSEGIETFHTTAMFMRSPLGSLPVDVEEIYLAGKIARVFKCALM
jgi:hypothetical protein